MKSRLTKSKKEKLHQKADEVWNQQYNKIPSHPSEDEALKLIYELQVHQIELELINEELIEAKQKAEIATEKYTDLFDFAPSGYFSLSSKAEILDLNIKGAEMLGQERESLTKQKFYFFVSRESKPVFNDFIENVFKNRRTVTSEIALLKVNKSPMYVFLTGIAKENEEQCLINMVDITQLKQMENDLVQAKETSEENNRLKTAFLQNMSHEIRTPLNAIKGFSEILPEKFDDKAKLEKFTKIIGQRCDDLLNIISDILDIAKIESGQLPLYIEDCSLNMLFEELNVYFIEYQQRLGKQHIQFKLFTPHLNSQVVINTDKGKLKQIFINLITNAFKFTDSGKIEVGSKFDNENLIFYVSDTGIGIPFDKQKDVFERFVQLKQGIGNTVSGTGLGLPIIKGLVSLLGGEIFLESEPGKGSTFSFTIPHIKIQTIQHNSLEREEPKEVQFSNETVLVVEDDFFNIEYLNEILADTGLHVLYAENGKEAVHTSLNQMVDLVLMDINLPDITGYEAIRQIKQTKPDLKIIVQTAYAAFEDKQKAFSEKGIDYISKPFSRDSLLTMIHKHLSG